jgi:Protein kinase domain
MSNNLFYSQDSEYSMVMSANTTNNARHFPSRRMMTTTPSDTSSTMKSSHGRKNLHSDAIEAPLSPIKKKSRGYQFTMFGTQLNDTDTSNAGKNSLNLFGSTQDSIIPSQQDMIDQVGGLSILSSQDCVMTSNNAVYNNMSNPSTNDGFSIPFHSGRTLSSDPSSMDDTLPGLDLIIVPDDMTLNNEMKSISKLKNTDKLENERKEIPLPVPVDNPFILQSQTSARKYRRMSHPRTMWITAFGERSRFLSDFEAYDNLGEGSYSVVTKAKQRLDGVFYAIKKLKKPITSKKEYYLFLREVCALSALSSCPNIVRYYNSWIDDAYLYIQTELCEFGNLEIWYITRDKRNFSLLKSRSDSLTSFSSSQKSTSHTPNNILPTPTVKDRSLINGSIPSSLSSIGTRSSSPFISSNSKFTGISESLLWLIIQKVSQSLSYIHEKGKFSINIHVCRYEGTCMH